MKTYKTRYFGIYLVNENDSWWITDDNGNERYIGENGYKTEDIEDFKNQVTK